MNKPRIRTAAAALAALALILAGCGGKSAGQPPAGQLPGSAPAISESTAKNSTPASGAMTVEFGRMKFIPDVIEISAGTTVTFVNGDEEEHSVWEGDPKKQSEAKWKSPDLKQGESWSYKFDTPGTIEVYCYTDSHFLQGMKAKIIVR